jgi:hypothetical protein
LKLHGDDANMNTINLELSHKEVLAIIKKESSGRRRMLLVPIRLIGHELVTRAAFSLFLSIFRVARHANE